MKRIDINEENNLVFYAKANEMVLHRYSRFQKYLLLKSGIGSSMESVNTHFTKLHGFIAHQMLDEIKTEAENLHYNFHAILQEIDYEDLAFAVCVHSINGEVITDQSEDNLTHIIKRLSEAGMTKEMLSAAVDDIKKKILIDLKLYFPKFFSEAGDYTFYQKLKQQMLLVADQIELGEESEEITEKLKEISFFFLELQKPNIFTADDAKNCIITLENNYESLCSMLETNGTHKAKELTLFEFYSRLEFIRKSNEDKKALYS